MNMKLQLFCEQILCASLLIQCAMVVPSNSATLSPISPSFRPHLSTTNSFEENMLSTERIKTTLSDEQAISASARPPAVKPSTLTSPATPATKTNNFLSSVLQGHFLQVVFVGCGLIAACTILLVSVCILACKVCHLSKKLKSVRMDNEVMGDSGCFMILSENNKCKPEAETRLLTNTSQEKLEMSNGATEEEGGIAKKEDGEPTASEKRDETPPPSSAEDTSLKPQGEATMPEPPTAAATEPSGGTEQPKEVSE